MPTPKAKKRMLTELSILKSAKFLFYEKGYAKTSVRDISEHSGVKLGTLTYFFNKKEDLVRRIYADHIIRLYSFIKIHKKEKMTNFEKNLHMTCLYEHFYSLNEKTGNFHLEIISQKEIYDSIYVHIFARLYKTLYIEIAETMSSEELNIAIIADLSVKHELSTRFLKKEYPKDSSELFSSSSIIMGRILNIPEEKTKLYISEAIDFKNSHTNLDDDLSMRLLI